MAVTCKICGMSFSKEVTINHLKRHGLTKLEYNQKYAMAKSAPEASKKTSKRTRIRDLKDIKTQDTAVPVMATATATTTVSSADVRHLLDQQESQNPAKNSVVTAQTGNEANQYQATESGYTEIEKNKIGTWKNLQPSIDSSVETKAMPETTIVPSIGAADQIEITKAATVLPEEPASVFEIKIVEQQTPNARLTRDIQSTGSDSWLSKLINRIREFFNSR